MVYVNTTSGRQRQAQNNKLEKTPPRNCRIMNILFIVGCKEHCPKKPKTKNKYHTLSAAWQITRQSEQKKEEEKKATQKSLNKA